MSRDIDDKRHRFEDPGMASKDKHLVIVRSVLQQGLTPAAAAARYGVSRQWVHELLNRYRAHGHDGLAHAPGHPRADRSPPVSRCATASSSCVAS